MTGLFEDAADNFLELASTQRLHILFALLQKKATPTLIAKEFGATKQEVHRNFARLEDGGLIEKQVDGRYTLTTFGQTICTQVPSIVFLSQNRKYFEGHTFGDIPQKFIMRTGQLATGQHVKGFVKVLEKWKTIYQNANQYIYEILAEVPLDLIEPIVKRIKKGVYFNYIFSESVVVPEGRKDLLKKLRFNDLIQKGMVERKMVKKVQTVLVLNEKEACIMFPTSDSEADLGEMFYGNDTVFHEWCLDYFRYCWYGSDIFEESKVKEQTV